MLDDLDFDGNRDARVPIERPSHSLLIMSSRDVLVQDMDSLDAVTDGLDIASSNGGDLNSRPRNILVRSPVIRRSFRNNISVLDCIGCEIVGDGDGDGVDSSCQLTRAQLR